MDTDREEILADFQACTGIDDVAECILHLEETNWNLIEAVNRVMPQDTQALPSEHAASHPLGQHRAVLTDSTASVLRAPVVSSSSTGLTHPISVSNDIMVLPSHSRTRALNFDVHYADRVINIVLNDCETVGTIKTLLYGELGISQCRQELRGWRSGTVSDSTRLSTLNLPKDNVLHLHTSGSPLLVEEITDIADAQPFHSSDPSKVNYRLNVTDKTNDKNYNLNFPGNKTIIEIKQDVFNLTDIPVRYQIWSGWPPSTINNENISLANSGVDYPVHSLTVEKSETQGSSRTKSSKHVVVDLTSDSSEEFEDASESFGIEDEMFMHEVSSKRLEPLMPEDAPGDLEAVDQFSTNFSARYGEGHAVFYIGTLDDALKEAFYRPAKERKLLAIYLHHDNSVLSNVFCTQLLCSEMVVSYLTTNFITWAWDLTFESNRSRLIAIVTQHFGSLAATTIRNFNVDQLPILLVIMRVRSATEVFTVIHGNVSLDELLTRLIHAVDVFSGQQQLEMVVEDEREAREMVKREQDAAYEASLMADRKKEEARRQEEEEKQRVAQREEDDRKQLEEARLLDEAKKNALRKTLEEQLPIEPDEDCDKPVSHIRVRLPSGEVISRRFLASTPLKVLLNFVTVKGYLESEYKVLTSWPRKDLTALDCNFTLEQLKLYPQETVTLEER